MTAVGLGQQGSEAIGPGSNLCRVIYLYDFFASAGYNYSNLYVFVLTITKIPAKTSDNSRKLKLSLSFSVFFLRLKYNFTVGIKFFLPEVDGIFHDYFRQ